MHWGQDLRDNLEITGTSLEINIILEFTRTHNIYCAFQNGKTPQRPPKLSKKMFNLIMCIIATNQLIFNNF